MNLPTLSVNRPTMISMFVLGIILIGVISFRLLPVEMMPNISFGDITIFINIRGGIPPQEIEERVCKPIEEAMGAVTHLKNIVSISKESNATIILEFEPGINMDFAALEVREKYARIKNKLPPEIDKPIIAKYEYMDIPIVILAVVSEQRTPEELRKIVDRTIKERIERVEGVARVEITGGREEKVLIEVDQHKLQAYGLPINKVVDIINLNNFNLLAGEIKRVKDKYLIRTIGEFSNLEEIENIGIATTSLGSMIRIKDIAEVKDSYLEPRGYARVNAKPVVSIYVQKETAANTIKVMKRIEKELKGLEKILDKDISILSTFNQADFIERAINAVKTSLYHGAILATVVLFAFLRDIRLIFVISLSIPLSLLITFSLMFFSKLTLNIMTLSGLALGVGLLVDNTIVVLDNIFKKKDELMNYVKEKLTEKGIGRKSAISGAQEVSLAIIASTLTTIIVFLPLTFINVEVRMLYSGIAIAITYAILASLLCALTLVPLLVSRFKIKKPEQVAIHNIPQVNLAFWQRLLVRLKTKKSLRDNFWAIFSGWNLFLKFHTIKKPNQITSNNDSIKQTPSPIPSPDQEATPIPSSDDSKMQEAPLPRLPLLGGGLETLYKKAISICLSFRYLIIIAVLICFVFALRESGKLEKEFIGIAEQDKLTIFIEMPTGTKLEVTDEMVKKVEQLVIGRPDIKTVTSKIEPWSSKVYLQLLPLNKRSKSTGAIIEELRPQTDKLDPAFIYYEEPEEVGTKEILIELYGYNYDLLKSLSKEVAQKLQNIPNLTDIKIRMREGRPEMRILVDKKRAAMFGLSIYSIAYALHTQMRGLVATRYRGDTINEPLTRLKERPTYILKTKFSPESKVMTLPKKGGEITGIYSKSEDAQELETIVRLEKGFRRTFAHLYRLTLVTPQGDQIYLGQIADFKLDIGPSEVWRKNKSRMIQVSANTGGMALGTVAEKLKVLLKDIKFPKDYFWQIGGNYDKMMRTQKDLTFALILSLVLVYMVLSGLFESLTQPLIILATVPLAAIGAVFALRLVNKPVGTGVLTGAIMLGGIVVNNAIVLIDRINLLRKKRGTGIRHTVIMASYDRLRPIMMTTLTTILGLVPMAIDKSESANLWSPLAITVIGGLMVSAFLTLFVIPCTYLIFRDLGLVK